MADDNALRAHALLAPLLTGEAGPERDAALALIERLDCPHAWRERDADAPAAARRGKGRRA